MKIKKHYSVIHSDKVLSLIKKRLSKVKSKTERMNEVSVEQWSNGREQGYSLFVYGTKGARINFAQQRNSDTMVVLCGSMANFDITTNQPNDDIWAKQKFFDTDEICAQYIVDKISEYVGG